jgi:hypothetical protein
VRAPLSLRRPSRFDRFATLAIHELASKLTFRGVLIVGAAAQTDVVGSGHAAAAPALAPMDR